MHDSSDFLPPAIAIRAGAGSAVGLSIYIVIAFEGAKLSSNPASIRAILRHDSLSKAVLKSSRITVSVRSLKTKASFQKGLIPMGKTDLSLPVTAQMSMTVKMMDSPMAAIMTAKRGEVHISSKKPKL